MSFSSEETFRNAAEGAAARWKNTSNPPPELKEQIMDSFRLTKRIQELVGTTGIYGPVRKAWKDAFQAVGCLEAFNFDDESQI